MPHVTICIHGDGRGVFHNFAAALSSLQSNFHLHLQISALGPLTIFFNQWNKWVLARFSFLTEEGQSPCVLMSTRYVSGTGGGDWMDHRDGDPNAVIKPSVKVQGFVEEGLACLGVALIHFSILLLPCVALRWCLAAKLLLLTSTS